MLVCGTVRFRGSRSKLLVGVREGREYRMRTTRCRAEVAEVRPTWLMTVRDAESTGLTSRASEDLI